MPTALRARLAGATFDTQIAELGLGARAINALDRANILTVEDLLTVPLRRLQRLRGVGNTTRREIAAAVKLLREQLGKSAARRCACRDARDRSTDGSTSTSAVSVLICWPSASCVPVHAMVR